MANLKKSEVEPNMMVRSTRYAQVLTLGAPNRRGMVSCRVWPAVGEAREVLLPWQVLKW